MNGLLGRLAGQALGANNGAARSPRVRPAMGVHAQVPLSGSNEPGVPEQPLVNSPQQARALHTMTTPEDLPPVLLTDTQLVHTHSHQVTTQSSPAASVQAPIIVSSQLPAEPGRALVREAPPRLLDEVVPANGSPPAVAPVKSAVRLPLISHSTASREATEVHVHIGRIEVSALLTASPPKATSASTRKTLPLGDYLARRSRS